MFALLSKVAQPSIIGLVVKALSNEIAPNPIIFFARENFPPIFRKGSVVFWARN
jgi:hypothetical protein